MKYANGKYRDRAIMTMTTTKNANTIKNCAKGGLDCEADVKIRQNNLAWMDSREKVTRGYDEQILPKKLPFMTKR